MLKNVNISAFSAPEQIEFFDMAPEQIRFFDNIYTPVVSCSGVPDVNLEPSGQYF